MRTAVVCVVFAMVLVACTMALAAPTVTISTNAETYESGDIIEVTLGVENLGPPTTLDSCVGLLIPDGSIYTLGPYGWVPAIMSWNSDMRMPTEFDMTAHFRFGVPFALPAPPLHQDGEYQFASLCLHPGTYTWASNLSLAPFSYFSSGPSTEITMVPIRAGSFLMGSPPDESGRYEGEGPQRTVNISAFQMSETEVTQKQLEDVMGWNDSDFSGEDHPVIQVTWFDCLSFCNELSEADGYAECYTFTNSDYSGNHITSAGVTCDFEANGYRLPTTAEWEYACRAQTTTRFNAGDSDSDLDRAGWYRDNSGSTTHTVGEKGRNAWGLYDMHGNVWEWCWDWYDEDYYRERPDPDTDPTGASIGHLRAMRGGGWSDGARDCRSARRGGAHDYNRSASSGFRVARSSD